MEPLLFQQKTYACMSSLIDKHELKRLTALMLPLYIANLLHMGLGVTDTLVAGWKSEQDLAAVAMGFSIFCPIMVGTGAILTILNAMISRLRGAGEESKVGSLLNNGKMLAIILCAFDMLVLFAASYVFGWVTDQPELADKAQLYIWFAMLGLPANLLLRVISANFEGYGQTRPAMIIALLSLLINIPLNYALVFGWGPLPALGGPGCGLATAIVCWASCLMLLLLMTRSSQHTRRAQQMLANRRPDTRIIRAIFRLGLPIGIATICELSFFSTVTLIIAPLGAFAVSAHQIAINLSGIIFMLPLSLSIAASIRAAYHIGGRRKEAFYNMLKTLLTLTYCLVCVLMLATILLREHIVGLYTDSPAVIALASELLFYCAVYQIPDATQAIMGGLLRGCHDTRFITWSNLIGYWVIGLPLAFILIRTNMIISAMGAAGAWMSFIIALSFTAVVLTLRFRSTCRKIFPATAVSR